MLPLTMRDAMDRLLDESFQPAWRMDLFGIGRRFPVDVYEDKLNCHRGIAAWREARRSHGDRDWQHNYHSRHDWI
jgi:hypothetical protein